MILAICDIPVTGKLCHPSVNIFRNGLLERTLHRGVRGLGLELGAAVIAASRVEGALQSVVLPSEEIVAVLAVSGAVEISPSPIE